MLLHPTYRQLKDMGKTSDDIKHVKIRTQNAAVSFSFLLASFRLKSY